MKELVAIHKTNANFKIKIVVQAKLYKLTKVVMVDIGKKPKAGVHKIQILKEKLI